MHLLRLEGEQAAMTDVLTASTESIQGNDDRTWSQDMSLNKSANAEIRHLRWRHLEQSIALRIMPNSEQRAWVEK